jgi:GT2 family glycosyltransferase
MTGAESKPPDKALPACDVVIVNWNSGRFLKECLASIERYGDAVAKVVVVDNDSTDGSDRIGDPPGNLELIRPGRNLGFAAGCNLGAERCASPYLLFLNPDARLFDGSIGRTLAFMETEAAKDIGICGIRLIDDDGNTQPSCMNFPLLNTYFGQATGLDRLFPRLFTRLFAAADSHQSRLVDQVMGAFFLIRAELFRELGGFDERFFVYMDDVDLSLRARQAGWHSYYFAEASAFHKGGGTSEQIKALRLFYELQSRLLFGYKHFSRIRAWALLLITVGIEPIARVGRALARRSLAECRNIFRGYGMLIGSLPWIWEISRRQRRSASTDRPRAPMERNGRKVSGTRRLQDGKNA